MGKFNELIVGIPLDNEGSILRSGSIEVKEQSMAYQVISWIFDHKANPSMIFDGNTHKISWVPKP